MSGYRPGIALALSLVMMPLWSREAVALDPRRSFSQYNHDVWRARDGLPHNSVQAILQTRDGYLWLGTQGGLVRFDGIAFTVFHPGNVPGMKEKIVLSLSETRDGALWVGTDGGGLGRFKDGLWTSLTTREGLAQNYVRTLHEGHDGSLWIGTGGGGLNRWGHGRLTSFHAAGGSPINTVRALLEDGRGDLWLGTHGGGLCRLRDGRFTPYTVRDGLASDVVASLWGGRDGSVWAATRAGLSRLKNGRFTNYTTEDGLSSNNLRTVCEDRQGNLWIGTLGAGLNRMAQGKFTSFTRKDGLTDDHVFAIHEDREGSLWVGTRTGLNRFKDGKFVTYTTKEGLANDYARVVYETRDGSIWVSTEDGLSRFENGRFRTYTARDGLAGNDTGAIFESRDGSVWVASGGGGLSRLRDGRIAAFFHRLHDRSFRNISALHEDRESLLVATVQPSLGRFRDGRITPFFPMPGPQNGPDLFAYSMHTDKDGTLWVGASEGLARFKGCDYRLFTTRDGLPHNAVHTILEDSDGSLWLATRGGISRAKRGTFTNVTVKQGLPDDLVATILDDGRGRFWIRSGSGVSWVRKKDLVDLTEGRIASIAPVTYGIPDGMRSTELTRFHQPVGIKSRDGRLWFATAEGVAVIDPGDLKLNTIPPPVVLESVLIDDRPVAVSETVEVSPGRESYAFHYTGLSLFAPEKVRFQYKLEGYDRGWVDAGSRRAAYYSRIPPGRYRFRVKASNNDGMWNQADASFSFRVRPYFYQTYWFYALCATALAAAGWLVHRLRIRQVETQFLAVLAERNRLARELHDTLEQGLAGVKLQLEAISGSLVEAPAVARQYLELARNMLRHSLDESHRSIMDLRSRALERADLVNALSSIASQMTAGTHVQAQLQVRGAPRRLPGGIENHLLRIGQEALTNALKHAQARHIRIEVRFDARSAGLLVQDDGCGFDAGCPASPSDGHFGLLGIRERVAKLAGTLDLRSAPGEGTELVVSVPLR